jgi:hypothetical protein
MSSCCRVLAATESLGLVKVIYGRALLLAGVHILLEFLVAGVSNPRRVM